MISALWTPPQGTIGCDTSAPLDANQAAALAEAGYRFLIRFVGLAGETPSWALTAREASLVQRAGLALGIVQIFRKTGISAAQGAADGAWAAAQSRASGAPAGVTIWCDVEGSYAGVAAPDLGAYLEAWGAAVAKAGYAPGLYIGPQDLLGAEDLVALPFQHHWMSAATVPDIPKRGYQMYQLVPMSVFPRGLSVAQTAIDIDVVQQDSEGSAPIFWRAPRAPSGLEGLDLPGSRSGLPVDPPDPRMDAPDEIGVADRGSAGDAPDDIPTSDAGASPPIEIIQASTDRFLTSRGATEVQLIVLHTMETKLQAGTSRNLAKSWSVKALPGNAVSAHYCVDPGAIFRSVSEDAVAFHAGPKANRISIGVEHDGFASFDAAMWSSADAQSMLTLSAQLVADICRRHRIPVELVTADELKTGKRGITTHKAVSRGLGGTDHQDPGDAFPIEAYLELVASFL